MRTTTKLGRAQRRLKFTSLVALFVLVASGCVTVGEKSGDKQTSKQAQSANENQGSLHRELPKNIRKRGYIKLGTDPSYAPCEYQEKGSDKIKGFDVDIWNEMADRLEVDLKVETTKFSGLIPGVNSGRFDIAMECISDTKEREKQVTFVDYSYGLGGVMYLRSNPGDITDDPKSMCGKKSGYQTGTVYESWFSDIINPYCRKHGLNKVKTQTLPGAGELQLALKSKRIDFVLADAAAAAYEAKISDTPLEIVTPKILPRVYMGIIMKQNNKKLANALSRTLNQMIDDGEYHKIMTKWDLEKLELENPGINLEKKKPIADE